jgi:hypothetical protein
MCFYSHVYPIQECVTFFHLPSTNYNKLIESKQVNCPNQTQPLHE